MRCLACLSLLLALHLAAAEVKHPKVEAVLAAYRVEVAENLADFEQELLAIKADHDRAVARDRDRALRDLKRLVSHRSEVTEQIQVYRAVLQVARDDEDATAFFGVIGTLDEELAKLDAIEPQVDAEVALGADLLGVPAAGPIPGDDGVTCVSAAADWPLDQRGLAFGPGRWEGLVTANHGATIKMPIQLPGGACYLHIRYAARSSRPMQLTIDAQVVAESCLTAVTGGWHLNNLGWDTVGPIVAPPGQVVAELHRRSASPHLRGIVVSRSPEPPAVDPFAEAGMTASKR